MADDLTPLKERAAIRAPAPVARPLFAWFLWSRQIKLRPAAQAIGVSHERIRQLCLPFGDDNRVIPDEDTAKRIAAWSGGVVMPWTFEDTPGARAISMTGGPAVSGAAA